MSIIKNSQEIVKNAQNELDARAREIALTLLESAISSVDPGNLVKKNIKLVGHNLEVVGTRLDLDDYDRIIVVGGGKASGRMAEALEEILQKRITTGVINVLRGTAGSFGTKTIVLNEAGHPIPDDGGLEGVRKMMELLKGLDERTLVINLLSGGGSALLPAPADGISLVEKQKTTSLLLKCGATIAEINVIRKHISALKGGRLAALAYPATLLCIILSDVVGDSLPSIASGPTVADPSTFSDAIRILEYYSIWEKTPESVRNYLQKGTANKNLESPKPGDPRLSRVQNIILGNNRIALESAERKATELGCNALILSSYIEGEARHVGTVLSALVKETVTTDQPIVKPGVLLAGGETTVTVTGSGRGGRNQEVALSSALRVSSLKGVAIASVGTDGLDGSSEAAGAIVDGMTLKRALDMGMEPAKYLTDNDSYHFFKNLNDVVVTGPTGTNVNDVMVLVALGKVKEGRTWSPNS